MSRLANSVRNIKVGTIGLLVSYLCSFISRKVFVVYLSAEYLGLNGLFSNILSLLSLAELGVGSAICFSLYKPLAFKETYKIQALMQLYRKAYTIIGLAVLVVGLSFTPLLPYLLKDIPDISNLGLLYSLYVVNSACTYFLSYKRTILIADQKRYIDSLYYYSFQIIKNLLQIVVLIATRNYILFLAVMLVMTIIENLVISNKVNSIYPFLKDKGKKELSRDEKFQIKRNVFALTFHKIGSVLVNGTDNILLVKFVSLVSAGLYANYIMIQSAITGIISIIFSSITASVGNLSVEKESEGSKPVFDQLFFISSWIFGFSALCLLFLFNPFISLWLGSEYLFSPGVVFVIVLNFYLSNMLRPVRTFKDSLGLFWADRYKSLFESLINLVVSIFLAMHFGLIGVFIGTTVSNLATCFWIEPYVLYKQGFNKPLGSYYVTYFVYSLVFVVAGFITFGLLSLVELDNHLLDFLASMCICAIVPNLVFLIAFYRTSEFRNTILLFEKIMHHNKK